MKRVRKSEKQISKIARRVATGQVVVCVLAVFLMVGVSFYFNRGAVAGRSIDYIAKDYYENFLYDRFVAGGKSAKEMLAEYTERAPLQVNLRQLLSFDGGRHGDSVADFYGCDKNAVAVKIVPVEPFGKRDYALQTQLDCEWE